jgi:hypothetical protein
LDNLEMLRSLSRKTIALVIAGLVAVTLTAAFAADLVPQDSQAEPPTAPITETETAAEQSVDTATVSVESQTVAETIASSRISSPSPSPTSSKSAEVESKFDTTTVRVLIYPQPHITVHIPLSIGVDPRSHSYQLGGIDFSGAAIYLACFYGHGVGFDAGTSNGLDNVSSQNFLVEGDRTPFLKISGTGAAISALLRANGGVRIFTSSGALSGRTFTLSLTALNSPATNLEYCGASRATSTSVFSPLQIDLGIVKGSGTLK